MEHLLAFLAGRSDNLPFLFLAMDLKQNRILRGRQNRVEKRRRRVKRIQIAIE
jgi:hypothetical protein